MIATGCWQNLFLGGLILIELGSAIKKSVALEGGNRDERAWMRRQEMVIVFSDGGMVIVGASE